MIDPVELDSSSSRRLPHGRHGRGLSLQVIGPADGNRFAVGPARLVHQKIVELPVSGRPRLLRCSGVEEAQSPQRFGEAVGRGPFLVREEGSEQLDAAPPQDDSGPDQTGLEDDFRLHPAQEGEAA